MRKAFALVLVAFSMLQLGSLANAKDGDPKQGSSKDGPAVVKHVGTADDSGSTVRDPQSNVKPDSTVSTDDAVEHFHSRPATGSNGRESWSR